MAEFGCEIAQSDIIDEGNVLSIPKRMNLDAAFEIRSPQIFEEEIQPNWTTKPENTFHDGSAHLNQEEKFCVKYLTRSNPQEPNKYERIQLIGEGTYGRVFKARNNETNSIVALKSIKYVNKRNKASFSEQVVAREIKILRAVSHENVIRLLDCHRFQCDGNNSIELELIFDYCEYELSKLILNKNVTFDLADIKNLMYQLFSGLDFIHHRNILHRDIKTQNILLTVEGILKIADFGLARYGNIPHSRNTTCLTTTVVSMWYRPPEIFFGDEFYDATVDLWSAGCIMGEFWTRSPIFPGNTEKQQLDNIFAVCGSIALKDWPEVVSLKLFDKVHMPASNRRRVKEFIQAYTKDKYAIDLLDQLLQLNPKKRKHTTSTVLNHDFFWFDPLPSDLQTFLKRLKYLKVPTKMEK